MHKKIGLACLLMLLGIIQSPGCARSNPTAYTPPREVARDPVRAQILTEQAVAQLDSQPDRAEATLRDALAADLYHGPAHNNLGVLYLSQGKLYEAANEFEWARRLMPGHPDPRLNLGLTLERAGRPEEAISTYAAALEVRPGHLSTMKALASCALRHDSVSVDTDALLSEITFRTDDPAWRDWAKRQQLRGDAR